MDASEPQKYTLKYITDFGNTSAGVPIHPKIVGVKHTPIIVINTPATRPNATSVCTALFTFS